MVCDGSGRRAGSTVVISVLGFYQKGASGTRRVAKRQILNNTQEFDTGTDQAIKSVELGNHQIDTDTDLTARIVVLACGSKVRYISSGTTDVRTR